MGYLETFFVVSLLVQFAHSIEELSTGFHKQWYLFKMPFWVFLVFEITFSLFWIYVWLTPSLLHRDSFQIFFLVLMLVNGVQHIVWWRYAKKYVPGLITAPIHILVSSMFGTGAALF